MFVFDSEHEGSEPGVQLVDDDRVEASPVLSVSPPSPTVAENKTQGVDAMSNQDFFIY